MQTLAQKALSCTSSMMLEMAKYMAFSSRGSPTCPDSMQLKAEDHTSMCSHQRLGAEGWIRKVQSALKGLCCMMHTQITSQPLNCLVTAGVDLLALRIEFSHWVVGYHQLLQHLHECFGIKSCCSSIAALEQI
jgi:hypothetical protein